MGTILLTAFILFIGLVLAESSNCASDLFGESTCTSLDRRGLEYITHIAVALLVATFVFIAGFLPTLVAIKHKNPKKRSVIRLNLLLDWSIIGWFIALKRAAQEKGIANVEKWCLLSCIFLFLVLSTVLVLSVIFDGRDGLEIFFIANVIGLVCYWATGIIAIIVTRRLPNRFMSYTGVAIYVLAFTGLGVLLLFMTLLLAALLLWAFWAVGIVINLTLIGLVLALHVQSRRASLT